MLLAGPILQIIKSTCFQNIISKSSISSQQSLDDANFTWPFTEHLEYSSTLLGASGGTNIKTHPGSEASVWTRILVLCCSFIAINSLSEPGRRSISLSRVLEMALQIRWHLSWKMKYFLSRERWRKDLRQREQHVQKRKTECREWSPEVC